MGNRTYQKRDEKEFFPTKDWVKEKLYALMDRTVDTILDPCCGEGGLEYFGQFDYKLMDIEDRCVGIGVEVCDFLKREPEENEHYDAAVINPPFGLTDEFIEHAFKFTDDIYLIAPLKGIIKRWCGNIVRYTTDWRIPFQCFGILTSIGLFHLSKRVRRAPAWGKTTSVKEEFYSKEYDPSLTWKARFFETDKAPNKYFIVNRLTKARVQRGEELIKSADIYAPNDDSAFVAGKGNTNVKKGERIAREIATFDTLKEAEDFRQLYIDNADSVRNYCYLYGNNILALQKIPDLKAIEDHTNSF